MTPADWASAARNVKYQQKSEDQRAINILESMLLGQRTPSDAATAIAATYEALIKESKYNTVGIFWSIFSNASRACGATGEQAGRLTNFIVTIQSLPDVLDNLGSSVKNTDGAVYWKDLPDWRITFREYGIDTSGAGEFPEGEWPWQEQVSPLFGATNFAATLLARAPFNTGMEFHACTAMSCALYAVEGDAESHQLAELYMPAAATWVLVSGPKLHEACVGRLKIKHTHSLYPDRWHEWKQRFEKIAINTAFSHDSREWASRAASQMETIH